MTVGTRVVDGVVDRGLLPDPALRWTIRRLLGRRLAAAGAGDPLEAQQARKQALLEELSTGPIAVATDDANEQHYEVPTELYELMLGPRLKYSSAYWGGADTLEAAEERMLRLTCRRADLADGQDILELGCGWGALTLWIAERYPASNIVAVSNSASQREHIEKQAHVRDLGNLTVLTRDVNELHLDPDRFDRVVSIEMFEHLRNHAALLVRVADWLRPDGRLFVHHFAHRTLAYPFETGGSADWMARHFFTGGLMPSDDWLLHLQNDLALDRHWIVDGTHYSRTLEAWLSRLDANADRARQLLGDTYGTNRSEAWLQRWRVFLIASSELFSYRGGREWHVTHLRMRAR